MTIHSLDEEVYKMMREREMTVILTYYLPSVWRVVVFNYGQLRLLSLNFAVQKMKDVTFRTNQRAESVLP